TYPRVFRGVVDVLAVRDGQSVNISAEPNQTAGVVEAVRQDVAVGASSDGQHLGNQAAPLEVVDDHRSCAMLVVADLWVGVNVAPDGDQSLVQRTGEFPDLG